MAALDLARWQFAITTVYHFLFVPLTLGTAWLVVGLQTAWVRTGKVKYLKLTKLVGKLFLINVAMGVVTGIVQEFQFGMNWSQYSRYVGDIFGAPLAMEALLAFFMESVFIGVWIFGWDKLPKKVHLATAYLTALGTMLSAYFILAANSWMQHPVGYELDPVTGRAVLNNIGEVLFQPTTLLAFSHTMLAAFLVSGAGVAAVGAWHLMEGHSQKVYRPAVKLGALTVIVAAALIGLNGDVYMKEMVKEQPMKVAAAEALYETAAPAPFSVLTVGNLDASSVTTVAEVPNLLSFLATGTMDGEVQGINNLQEEYTQLYGPGNYVPYVPLTYWSFRLMIMLGMIAALWAVWALWRFRKDKLPLTDGFFKVATMWITLFPLIGISFGWIFTEVGRQPWIVFGLMKTEAGVSPLNDAVSMWITLIGYTLIYAALAVVEVKLLLKYAKAGAPEDVVEDPYEDSKSGSDKQLYFAY